jgi:iron-sulfur cluster repair protein YtfE (RIC family)
MYNHIHRALGGELDNLEAHARSINPDRPEEAGAFAGHLEMIENLLEIHSQEEEQVVWPEIDRQTPGLLRAYELDHEADKDVFARIHSHLGKLQQQSAESAGAQTSLARDTGVLAEQAKLHMRKEEEHIYGPFAESIGRDEQMEIGRRVLSNLPVEMLPQGMPWLASFLTAEEVAEGFELYVEAVGPERGRLFVSPLATSMPPEKWQAVLQHAPQLASYTS